MPTSSPRSPWLRSLLAQSIRRPWLMLGGWLALLIALAPGLLLLDIDTSTSSFLDRSGPEWKRYQDSLATYGGDEFLVVAIPATSTGDRKALARVVDLTSALEALPGVRRVDSLASVPLIRLDDQGIIDLGAGLRDGVPQHDDELAALRSAWRSDRIVPRSLISADEGVLSLNVILDANVDGDRAAAVEQATLLVAASGGWVTGVPVFRTAVNSRTRTEVLLFVPLTLLGIGVILASVLRGLVGIGIALSVGLAGSAAALATMGFLGVSLSLSTMVLPSILLGLGCAYSMHVLTAARGHVGAQKLEAALGPVARPVALSGLTTAIGFLAMATVPIAAIRDLASYGALGVFVCTLATLTLAPAMLVLRPLAGEPRALERWLRVSSSRRIVEMASRVRLPLIASWIALSLLVGLGIARLQVSTDIIVWFPRGSEVREAYETVRSRLSGISPVNVVVAATGEGRHVTEGPVAQAIDRLTHDLEALPQVGRGLAYTDPVRQFHRVGQQIPDAPLSLERDAIEQYLLLLEGIDQIDDVLSRDHRGANILLRVNDNASSEIIGLAKWVDEWWAEHGVDGFRVSTTGIMYEFARAEEAIAYGQIQGLAIALLTITAILWVVFRSLRTAFLALLANTLPLAMAFGAMGLLGIPLDAATVCMGSVALGIAVDDTIHILEGFGSARGRGQAPEEALASCLARVLPALVFTTLSIAVGFGVLAASDFSLIRNLGLVTSSVVILCLVADLSLLPALLSRPQRR